MDKYLLGKRIRQYRVDKGVSQLELESRIDASPGTLSRIENGVINPTKETLLKIIDALGFSSEEAASLFDIDLKSEINAFIEITKKINPSLELSQTFKLITDELIKLIGIKYATIWLWDNETKLLRLMGINIPINVRKLTEQLLNIPISEISFDSTNKIHTERNYILKAYIQDTITITDNFSDISVPIGTRYLDKLFAKLLNMKKAIHVPISYNNERYGALGIIWNREMLTDDDISTLQNFADLVAMFIYNAKLLEKYKGKPV